MSFLQTFGRFVTSISVDGVERLGWVLVHSVWQLALLAFAAALTVRAMRRSSAATHYSVLVTAMGFSILIPVTTWVLLPASPSSQVTEVDPHEPGDFPIVAGGEVPAIRLRHGDPFIAPYREEKNLESNLDTEITGSNASDGVKISPLAGDEMPWLERLHRTARPWMTWIVGGWISGVLIFALRPLLGWRMLSRLRHTGAASVSEEVNGVLRSAACRLGLHRTAVGVLQSTLVQVPIVVGYLRPLILLPASLLTSIPPTQLEAILAHELAHIVRHDFLVNLLQTLIETLFFYHPAIWWLSHRIRIEREHCCDDLVVSTWGNQVEYGRALLAVAQLRRQSHVLALGATDGSLRSRVGRLFHVGTDRPNDRLMNRLPATLLSLACLGVTIVALLAAHLPVDADDTSAVTTKVGTQPVNQIAEENAEQTTDSSTDDDAVSLTNQQTETANESTDVGNPNLTDQRRVSLRGRVNDANGNPVANALVLYPVRFDTSTRKFRLARTTSNERGEFTLQVPKILFGNDPRKVHHVVWCWAEGHGIGTASIRSHGTEQPRPPILIKLPDTQPLEFVVLSEEKQPIAGAIVAPSMMRTPVAYYPIPEELKAVASRTSDEKGQVRLELVPKDVLDSVSVVTKSHGEQQFSHLSGNLQLLPVASVDGNIQGGLPGVRLLFCNYRNETRTEFATISDQQGRFTIPAFPTGVYTVRSDLPGPLMLATLDVLKPGHQTLTLQVDKGIPFKGRLVVRGTDRGVKNTLIRVQSGFNHQHDFDVTSNDRGEFQSYVLPGHQMRVQVYGFDPNEHFIFPGFKAFEVPDDAAEFTAPDIEIDPAKVWKGTVVDVNNVPVEDLYVEPKTEDKPTTPEKTDSQGRFEFWLRENVTPSGWRVTQTSEGSIVGEIDAETVSEKPSVIRIPLSRSQLEEDVLRRRETDEGRNSGRSKVPQVGQPPSNQHETRDPPQEDARKQTWMKWHLDPRLDMPFDDNVDDAPVFVVLADIARKLEVVLKINEAEILADVGSDKTLSMTVTRGGLHERIKRIADSPNESDGVLLMLLRDDGTINVREVLMLITEPILLDFLLVDDVLHVSTVEGIRSIRMATSAHNSANAATHGK